MIFIAIVGWLAITVFVGLQSYKHGKRDGVAEGRAIGLVEGDVTGTIRTVKIFHQAVADYRGGARAATPNERPN